MNWFYHTTELLFFRRGRNTSRYEANNNKGLVIEEVYNPSGIPEDFLECEEIYTEWQHRFRAGHCAYVAYVNGEPVHLSWLAVEQLYIGEIAFLLHIGPGTFCIYDCTTLEIHRGRGYYPAVLERISQECNTRITGCDIWIYCDPRNKSSMRGIQKAGFTEQGTARTRFLFGMPVSRSNSIALQELCLDFHP